MMIRTILLFAATILFFPSAFSQDENPKVSTSVFHAVSEPLREMTVVIPGELDERNKPKTIENPSLEKPDRTDFPADRRFGGAPLSGVQKREGNRSLGAPFVNVEGLDNLQSVAPADPNGDVGKNYYVQTINRSFAVYDKQGNLVYGPVHNTSIWESLPGPWADVSWGGDPIFKYDHRAERWVMSAFSINSNNDQYYELVAVSTSSSPLGSYNLYAFQFENFNDYPKLAIWHDAYYITYNIFRDGDRVNPLITAVDRDAMIAGEPEARMIEFEYEENLFHNIPYCTDIEGYNISTDAPNFVLTPVANPQSNPPFAALHMYEFQVDWEDPDSSSFEFIKEMPIQGGSTDIFSGVQQPGGIAPIDALAFRLMYPVSYRDFGTHESIVACHSLRFPGGTFHKRWYELRRGTGEWNIHQSGSYLDDGLARWMGSINMNVKGDIALGYSATNEEVHPSVRYTGRFAGDSLDRMTLREITAYPGEYPANNVAGDRNRWGDYSSMSVDPVGDSTFWFTTMSTEQPVSFGNWSTRIVAFNLRSDANNIVAEAGLDRLICDQESVETDAFARNYSRILWTTDGDGYFDDNSSIDATYLLGEEDRDTGTIVLTLHAEGYAPGEEVTDSFTIDKRKNPVADAGADTTICEDNSYMLNGSVAFADSFTWEIPGAAGGTLTDNKALNAIYTPSVFDKFKGYAELELTVYNSSACKRELSDAIQINLEECTDIERPSQSEWTLQLEPNPTEGAFTAEIRGPKNEFFTIQIFTPDGQKIFNGRHQTRGPVYRHNYDLRKQPAGTYYLRIFNEKMSITRPMIKK